MATRIVYATGDDFKWEQRRALAKRMGIDLHRGAKVEIDKRIEIIETLEEALNLKWRLATRNIKDWVIVDMNDVLLATRESWYSYRKGKKVSQDKYVSDLWLPIDGMTADLTKIGLRNVLMIGKKGFEPIFFQGILDGIVMYRPSQKGFLKLPAIVPHVYVPLWQQMLDQIYRLSWDERTGSRVTHDSRTLIDALSRVSN